MVAKNKILDDLWHAALSCPHTITQEEVVLRYQGKGKNASQELYKRLEKVLQEHNIPENLEVELNLKQED